jgi:predicted DCC family thiol-disulfide oxidoreductase YuxK
MQFIMEHDKEGVYPFIPGDSARGQQLIAWEKIEDDDLVSIILLEEDQPDLPSEQYSR